MLTPGSNRVDYGTLLQPPQGYALDAAIATTYSLDLDTLLTVPVAMCFNDTLEGDLQGEHLALLKAIGQLKGRIKIFYQSGKIKIPPDYNRLFVLLEPWLEPVLPEGGAYSSFHPKLWLLRYYNETEPDTLPQYRLLVLSRNLTFDRSWDIACALEGRLQKDPQRSAISNGWVSFVSKLLDASSDFAPGEVIARELTFTKWTPPSGFRNPKLQPGGPGLGNPTDLGDDNEAILVMSPFLSDAAGQVRALNRLKSAAPAGKRYLFSRAEELDRIGSTMLEDWACWSINQNVVDGEERLQIGNSRQNLHAKLIVTKRGKTSHWHLGSANATTAALGDTPRSSPRNIEFMLRLTGATDRIGPDTLLSQLTDEHGGKGLFEPHHFQPSEPAPGDGGAARVREAIYQLTGAKWELAVSREDQPTYSICLTCTQELGLPSGVKVEVGQLAVRDSYRTFPGNMIWSGLSLSQVSALFPMRISTDEDQNTELLVIQARLLLPEGTSRESQIYRQLIGEEGKFLNYIRLLLKKNPEKSEWLGIGHKGNIESGFHEFLERSSLFEELMAAAARQPATMRRISTMLEEVRRMNVPIPESFAKLWHHFESMIGK